MSTFKIVTTNTLYQAFGKGASLALSLIATGLLTRHLGQAGYGQYTLITTLILFFGSITDWGTGFIASRMASQNHYPPSQIYGNTLIFRLTASLIGIFLLTFLTYLNIIKLPLLVVLIGSLILCSLAIRNTLQVIFQVNLKLQYAALGETLTSVFFLILIFWITTYQSLNPASAIASLLIATTLAAGIGLYFATRLTTFNLSLNRLLLRELLYEAAPMGALLVVFSIYNRLDIFLLQHFQGDQAVGLYGLAYKLHDNAVFGAAFFMNSLYPLIAKSSQGPHPNPLLQGEGIPSPLRRRTQDEVKPGFSTRHLFSTAFHLLFLAGALVSLTLIIIAQPLVLLIAGPDYLPAVPLIRILMLATFIAYLNHLTGYTLAALGLQRFSLKVAVLALFTNLLLNFIFIPHFSYYASATITIFTEALVFIFSIIYLNRRQNLSPNMIALPSTLKNLLFHRKQLF